MQSVGRRERRHFDQRLASLGNDEWLTLASTLDEARQMSFGFVDIDSLHFDQIFELSLLTKLNFKDQSAQLKGVLKGASIY